MDVNKYLAYWADRYYEDVTKNILPFWLKYGLDEINGGVYTCVDLNPAKRDVMQL